eukprot:m.392698 g.392698  ORF g.392698 m.392698 type:complete len:551 (+) comp21083_c0_seq1:260-1912(+)
MAGARAADPDRICGTDAIPRLMLYDVFKIGKHLKIPIFQRRYCWGKPQLARFLSDVITQTGGNGGVSLTDALKHRQPNIAFGVGHSLGRLMVSTATTPVSGDVMVLDGQQRLTTSCLLLAALRDIVDSAMQHYEHAKSSTGTHAQVGAAHDDECAGSPEPEVAHTSEARCLIETINAVLLDSKRNKQQSSNQHCVKEPPMGHDNAVSGQLPKPSLSPTYFDRSAYEAAVGFPIDESKSNDPSSLDPGDWILCAKQYFKHLLSRGDVFRTAEKLGQRVPADRSNRDVRVLSLPVVVATCSAITRALLLGCNVLWFDVREEDLFTVYERLAYRDTMLAKYMHNKTPGQDMGESDLSRNFLLSYFAGDDTQIAMLHTYWIPLELAVGGGASVTQGSRQRVDGMLEQFLCKVEHEAKEREEQTTDGRTEEDPKNADGAVHLATGMPQLFPTYKRLREHVEARLRAADEPLVASTTTPGAAAIAESVLKDLLAFATSAPRPAPDVTSGRDDVFARPSQRARGSGRTRDSREQPQFQIHVDTSTNPYSTTAPPWKQ